MNRLKLGGLGAALVALLALLLALPMVLGRSPAPPPVSAPASSDVEEELPTEADEPEAPAPEQPPVDPFVVPPERAPRAPQNSGPPPADSPTDPGPTTPQPEPTPPVDPGPGDPEPVDPGPVDPEPVDPTPEPTTTPPPDPGPTAPPTPPTGPLTVVSLTFDDGRVSQRAAVDVLNARGVDGTFYVNSGTIGLSGSLSRSDLEAMAAAGHEIGGHSATHPDLPSLPVEEIARQICDDRTALLSWGFAVRNFAYPFASANSDVESRIADCGYNSGRMLGDLRSPFSCASCDPAETIPPANPFYLRAPDQVENTWTLQTLKDAVLAAETTGGWLPLTFHDVCATDCGQLGVPTAVLDDFVAWILARGSTVNTVIRTTGDVIGGPVQPAVSAPAVPPPAPAGANGIVNASLEQTSGGVPTCWYRAPWGSNTPEWQLTSAARTGGVASQITMSGYASGDAKILPIFDLGACAPTVAEGQSYSLRAWYASSTVTQFAVYLRTTQGGWVYWTSSPWFAASDVYTEAEWTSGPIPAGYNGISFGLNIFGDGVLVTDDYALYNSVGAPPVATEPSTISPLPIEPAAPAVEAVAPEEGVDEGDAAESAESDSAGGEPADSGSSGEGSPTDDSPTGAPPTDAPPSDAPPTDAPPADAPPAPETPPATEPPAGLEPAAPPVEAPDADAAVPSPEAPPAPGDSSGT